MTLGIMTFSKMTLSIKTFSKTNLIIMTFSITDLIVTLGLKDTQHYDTRLNQCHYTESRVLFIGELNVLMLNVGMLSVVMLSVLALFRPCNKSCHCYKTFYEYKAGIISNRII
jgi:hypothetical protein